MYFRSSRFSFDYPIHSLKEKKITLDFTPLKHAYDFALKIKETNSRVLDFV